MDAMTTLEDAAPVKVRMTGEGSAVHLELDSPATRNALSPETVRALRRAVESAVAEERAALAMTSTGPAFAAGMDLRQIDHADDETLRRQFREIQGLLTDLYQAPLVTVAVLDGDAVGAGADLALACDHRIGSPRTTFRFPGPQFGLLLGTRRLAQETSPAIAQGLALTGAKLSARRALDVGLLTQLVEADQLESTAGAVVGAAGRSAVGIAGLTRAVRRDRPAHSDLELLEESMTPGLAQRMTAFRDRTGRRR